MAFFSLWVPFPTRTPIPPLPPKKTVLNVRLLGSVAVDLKHTSFDRPPTDQPTLEVPSPPFSSFCPPPPPPNGMELLWKGRGELCSSRGSVLLGRSGVLYYWLVL